MGQSLDAMEKELHHYNCDALAESIRYILHYTKQVYKDIKHDFEYNHHDGTDKRVPLYKEGDRILDQSLAVAKYVARDTDLTPKDPWDQAVLENIAYDIHEYWPKLMAYVRENDENKKHAMKLKLIEETIDYYFSKFEKRLEEHGGFFIGKLSWIEFVLCSIVEISDLFLGIELATKYPMVAAVVEIIRNLPGVKEHIATRGPYNYNPTNM